MDDSPVTESRLELDSHADSQVLGMGAIIVKNTGRKVSVRGFTDKIGKPIEVPVVDGILLYKCDISGEQHILIIRNALHVKSMKNHLIPPFVMRLAGVEVDECPKFLARSPSLNNHSLFFSSDDIRIPLALYGKTPYVLVRTPSSFDSETLPTLDLTPATPLWDPHNPIFQEQEDAMVSYNGTLIDSPADIEIFQCSLDRQNWSRLPSEFVDRPHDDLYLADDLLCRRHCSIVSTKGEEYGISSINIR